MLILFKTMYGFDVLVALIILYFFFVGIGDGTVSSFNIVLWLVILSALAAILGGSLWLKSHHHIMLAVTTLLIITIPALLFVSYFLIAILGNGRWN